MNEGTIKPQYEVRKDPDHDHAVEVWYRGERFLWWNEASGSEYPEDMCWTRDIGAVFNAGIKLAQKAANEPRWALYGIRESLESSRIIGGPFELRESRELVAFFSSEAAAKKYVKKARLKNPIPRRGFSDPKVYRKASLLWGYSSIEIEMFNPPSAPLDPTL